MASKLITVISLLWSSDKLFPQEVWKSLLLKVVIMGGSITMICNFILCHLRLFFGRIYLNAFGLVIFRIQPVVAAGMPTVILWSKTWTACTYWSILGKKGRLIKLKSKARWPVTSCVCTNTSVADSCCYLASINSSSIFVSFSSPGRHVKRKCKCKRKCSHTWVRIEKRGINLVHMRIRNMR